MTQNVFFLYFRWHYSDKIKGIIASWKNLLRFNKEYFSLPLLLKTFFSYWRNYHEDYKKGSGIKGYFSTFVFNVISRGIGAFIRFWVIIFGIILEILIFLGGLIALLGWIFLPFLLLAGIFLAFKIIF